MHFRFRNGVRAAAVVGRNWAALEVAAPLLVLLLFSQLSGFGLVKLMLHSKDLGEAF